LVKAFQAIESKLSPLLKAFTNPAPSSIIISAFRYSSLLIGQKGSPKNT